MIEQIYEAVDKMTIINDVHDSIGGILANDMVRMLRESPPHPPHPTPPQQKNHSCEYYDMKVTNNLSTTMKIMLV